MKLKENEHFIAILGIISIIEIEGVRHRASIMFPRPFPISKVM